MKSKTLTLATLLMVSVVFAAGCVQQSGDKTLPDGSIQKADGTIVKPDGTMVKPDGTMILPNGTMIEPENKTIGTSSSASPYSGAVLAGSSAPLIDFNKADYDSAAASDELVVLYFYATWCPICRAEEPELRAAFNDLDRSDVIGFRVNFNDGDTDADERALAQQYQVPYQHTKVFIKNGQQLLKAPDTWNKARYLTEISNYA